MKLWHVIRDLNFARLNEHETKANVSVSNLSDIGLCARVCYSNAGSSALYVLVQGTFIRM